MKVSAITLLLMFLRFDVWAQKNVYFEQAYEQSVNSYWAASTGPAKRNMVISFFDENHHLNLMANPLVKQLSVMPKILIKDDGRVFVYLYNPNQHILDIKLLDQERHELHGEKTAREYYGKLLNIDQLAAGRYFIELNSGNVRARYKLELIDHEHSEVIVTPLAAY